MNHELVAATTRRFLKEQRVDHRVPVEILHVIWTWNLLSLTTWPKSAITITPAGEAYLAEFGGPAGAL